MTCATKDCEKRASHVCDVQGEGMSYVVLCEEHAALLKESGEYAWRIR